MIKKVIRRIKRYLPKPEDPTYVIDSKNIIIRPESVDQDNLNNALLLKSADQYVPKREITSMKWNGAKLNLEGYFYLEGIEITNEDFVKKNLILVNESNKATENYTIPLRDKKIKELSKSVEVSSRYKWSGFEGDINFNSFMPKNKPLVEGDYRVYLEIQVDQIGFGRITKRFPLGNVEKFFTDGFHTAKMEFFTASLELKYNLLANYDFSKKTLRINSTKLKELDPRELGLNEKEKNDIVSKFIRKYVFKVAYYLFWLRPVKQNKVLFASDSRDDLSGNFEFVYNEMLRQQLPLDYRFLLKPAVDRKKTIGEIIKLAKEIATSRYILLDDFYPMIYGLRIRKNADLVQLWHAVGAFKTFGFSRIGRPGGPSPKSPNHRNYTIATVSATSIRKHYAEGFGISEENVVATGIPRTDVFFNESYKEEVRTRLHQDYPYLKDKKVIMFAPTFRGNGQQSAYYDLDALNLDEIYRNFKDEYIFIFKLHPFVKNSLDIPYMYSDFYYDFSDYREINDLLFVTDILITDYSSVCFEFALLNKPMIFFAYDVEDYVQSRDFYYEYNTFIPGPLAKTTQDIIDIIQYQEFKMDKIEPFKQYFFDDTDGESSKRVVNYLFNQQIESDDK